MKRILHISTYYYPQFGGIEQVAYDVIDILKNQNTENRVICFSETGKYKEEIIEDIKVYKVGYIKKIFSQALSISYYFKLKEIIEEFNPDYIHLHLPNPLVGVYLNKLLKNKQIKLVIHWHSDIVKQKLLKKIYNYSQKTTLEKSSKILVTSKEYAENSNDLLKYLDKVEVLPNIVNEDKLVVNTKIIKRIKEIKKENKGKKIIFFIGVHREYKGLKYLIEASKFLSNDYKIIIAGSGPLTELLKEKSKLNEKIKFIGKIPDEEKIAYFNAANIFSFPSITKNEAFGVALAEALYFGLPAVTFKINGSGVNWVNKNNVTGKEVAEKNPVDYAQALKDILKNSTYYSKNAKERTKELFTKKAITGKLQNIYEIGG